MAQQVEATPRPDEQFDPWDPISVSCPLTFVHMYTHTHKIKLHIEKKEEILSTHTCWLTNTPSSCF